MLRFENETNGVSEKNNTAEMQKYRYYPRTYVFLHLVLSIRLSLDAEYARRLFGHNLRTRTCILGQQRGYSN